jgi:hypothetical protein
MRALYQIIVELRPYICVRQAESHSLAQHILEHPYWQKTVRPCLSASFSVEDELPNRDGIEESADKVYLPPGVPDTALVTLQSIVDGWVMNKGDA